jgi:trehalose 6-phosphate phosphatase
MRVLTIMDDHTELPPLGAGDGLLTDFDGTLVPIADRPDAIQISPDLIDLLTLLKQKLDGALAVLTGRRLESIDGWLSPLRLCGAGLHGAQLRLSCEATHEPLAVPGLTEEVERITREFADEPGVLVEFKGSAVALHYRLAPQASVRCQQAVERLAANLGLAVISGHCVVEARSPYISKGTALIALSATPAFVDRRLVFIGDDITDEDAIVAAQQLGGIGIRVGRGFPQTAARYRLATVTAVHHWLRRSLVSLESMS